MQKRNLLLTLMAIIGFTAITIAQTVPPYVPTNGILAWFPLDGNGNDASGNGNNATNFGATFVSNRCGTSNSAAHFNGINNYLQVATPSFAFSETGTFTYSIWLKKQVNTGGVVIMSGTNTAGNFISNMQGQEMLDLEQICNNQHGSGLLVHIL